MLSVVQMGGGGTSGIITGDSDTYGLDNLEFEVAGERDSFITYCTIQHNTNHSILDGNFGSRYQWRC